MVIWPVLAGSGKTADLVLACFGWFRNHRGNVALIWHNPLNSTITTMYCSISDIVRQTVTIQYNTDK